MSKILQQNDQRVSIDRCHLFGIKTPHALAKRLGWDLKKLNDLAADGGYRVFNHKKTGREIQEPGRALQSLHRQLHRYLARLEVPAYLHSAIKGKSYVSNARAHIGAGRLIKIDIAKFYPSVLQHKVMHFFRDSLRCGPDVAGLLANLVCFRGALATGSSVSPFISFYAYKSLFDDLDGLAARNGLVMTCYVDDITLSGAGASALILHEARTMIFRAGLRAHKDQQFHASSVKVVTGVMVGDHNISLPFSRWQKIGQATKELVACRDPNEKLLLYPKLVSRLYEATQIDPSCRPRAEYYHERWRSLKQHMATLTATPATEAIAA